MKHLVASSIAVPSVPCFHPNLSFLFSMSQGLYRYSPVLSCSCNLRSQLGNKHSLKISDFAPLSWNCSVRFMRGKQAEGKFSVVEQCWLRYHWPTPLQPACDWEAASCGFWKVLFAQKFRL